MRSIIQSLNLATSALGSLIMIPVIIYVNTASRNKGTTSAATSISAYKSTNTYTDIDNTDTTTTYATTATTYTTGKSNVYSNNDNIKGHNYEGSSSSGGAWQKG